MITFLEVSDFLLSTVVLLTMILSIFVSIVYTCLFLLVPFDPETKDEKNPLLDGDIRGSADAVRNNAAQELATSNNENHDVKQTMYLEMTFYTLAYALICAGRFNSIKALLQINWPADETTANIEVEACGVTFCAVPN
jgi:hypothetical protein